MTDAKKISLAEKLMLIQSELKAPKGQYNSFGKYKYRSAEDILEAVKPILAKYRTILLLTDEIKVVGDEETKESKSLRTYVSAMAQLCDVDSNDVLSVTAMAREPQTKTGMDASQITGTASSYARKYALNGLFCIDDTKDADTDEYHEQTQTRAKQTPMAKSVSEYMALIDNAEDERNINNLYYEWSKVYPKGTNDYKLLSDKSFERKKQIVGA